MSLPTHLGLRLLVVAALCPSGRSHGPPGTLTRASAGSAARSQNRIAARSRVSRLGSADQAAMPASAPQPRRPSSTLLPGICADIQLGWNCPPHFCVTGDGLDAAPRGSVRSPRPGVAASRRRSGRSCIVNAPSAVSRGNCPSDGIAARLWRRTRLAGGLALGLAAATLLLTGFT